MAQALALQFRLFPTTIQSNQPWSIFGEIAAENDQISFTNATDRNASEWDCSRCRLQSDRQPIPVWLEVVSDRTAAGCQSDYDRRRSNYDWRRPKFHSPVSLVTALGRQPIAIRAEALFDRTGVSCWSDYGWHAAMPKTRMGWRQRGRYIHRRLQFGESQGLIPPKFWMKLIGFSLASVTTTIRREPDRTRNPTESHPDFGWNRLDFHSSVPSNVVSKNLVYSDGNPGGIRSNSESNSTPTEFWPNCDRNLIWFWSPMPRPLLLATEIQSNFNRNPIEIWPWSGQRITCGNPDSFTYPIEL